MRQGRSTGLVWHQLFELGSGAVSRPDLLIPTSYGLASSGPIESCDIVTSNREHLTKILVFMDHSLAQYRRVLGDRNLV